ncbi:hypothetical protein EP7_003726 [Isosphaeraceae bacterium EP7]
MKLPDKLSEWLGADWPSPPGSSPAQLLWSKSSAEVAAADWSVSIGQTRVIRTIAVLRRFKVALIAEQVEQGHGEWSISFPLPAGSVARKIHEKPSILVEREGALGFGQILPLSLECRDDAGCLDRFDVRSGNLTMTRTLQGGVSYSAILIAWGRPRSTSPATWTPLTVTEQARECPGTRAFAVRASWGKDQFVVYRSLAEPTLRAFLGHQTSAKFLMGRFTPTGTVQPIILQNA